MIHFTLWMVISLILNHVMPMVHDTPYISSRIDMVDGLLCGAIYAHGGITLRDIVILMLVN